MSAYYNGFDEDGLESRPPLYDAPPHDLWLAIPILALAGLALFCTQCSKEKPDDDTLTLLQKSDAQTDQFNQDSKPSGLLNPR